MMKKCILLLFVVVMALKADGQTITIGSKVNLASELSEISGLIHVKGKFYAMNDGGNSSEIHQIDTQTGLVLRSVKIKSTNTDWEELTADDTFIYIGDVGNNKGNRKDLKVLRINISDLAKDSVIPDVIRYSYLDQTDYSSRDFHNYDCEALVPGSNGLFIFTKNRLDLKCNLHWIPKTPGSYITQKLDSTGLDYMITGASVTPFGNLFLCGYDYSLNYYVSALFDWNKNKRLNGKISTRKFLDGPKQYESIVSLGDSAFLMAAESLSGSGSFLVHGLVSDNKTGVVASRTESLMAYPNEFVSDLTVIYDKSITKLCLINNLGKTVFEINTDKLGNKMVLDLDFLTPGSYNLIFKNGNQSIKSIKVDKI